MSQEQHHLSLEKLRALNLQITGCANAHQRLLASLDGLSDQQCRDRSLLPIWSRAHVLTHLARNADSHRHLLQCATAGEIGDQYPSVDQRNQEIELGATRTATEIIGDLRSSIYKLEAVWAASDTKTWVGYGRSLGRNLIEMSSIVFMRWREVEFHHADLGLSFGYDDLSPLYVKLELEQQIMLWASRKSMGMTELPNLARQLTPTQRLAWLLGRLNVEGLDKPEPI